MKNLSFVFPGQGSQAVAMLSSLANAFSSVKETFDEASDILGYDLWKLVRLGPASELNKTWKTQPALLVSSVAIYRVWRKHVNGVQPTIMAGHSLGEYSALVCSNTINFSDAVRLVEIRGNLMNDAVPSEAGAMFAIIGLDDSSVKEICEESAQDQVVSPVNFNAPGQVVVAGNKEAVERAIDLSKKRGAKRAIRLPVSVPSHCKLMRSISSDFLLELEKVNFSIPSIPVVNNVDVRVETDPKAIRDALVRQLYSPVRWTETINFMVSKKGITSIFEIGPGSVLTGLNRRINNDLNLASINDPLSFSSIIEKYIKGTL